MPDPAPDVYGGGLPQDVVAFGDEFVAVGTINASCCAEGDPALNSGVVWTSGDGRTWDVHADIAAFEHASLRQVVTNGMRLVVVGSYADPAPAEPAVGQTAVSVAAVWTSTDGRRWTRAADPVPEVVAVIGSGFIGASRGYMRSTGDPVTSFLHSIDGTGWDPVAGGHAGAVDDLIATPDGGALAVGYVSGPPLADGSPTWNALVWRSPDGVAWPLPETAVFSARLRSVVAGGPGFIAVGWSDELVADGSISSPGTVWTSADGKSWDGNTIPDAESLNVVFAVPGAFLIEGDVTENGVANAAVWVSANGLTWTRVADQGAFAGVNNAFGAVAIIDEGILAVGSRWDGLTNHPLPQAWLSAP